MEVGLARRQDKNKPAQLVRTAAGFSDQDGNVSPGNKPLCRESAARPRLPPGAQRSKRSIDHAAGWQRVWQLGRFVFTLETLLSELELAASSGLRVEHHVDPRRNLASLRSTELQISLCKRIIVSA